MDDFEAIAARAAAAKNGLNPGTYGDAKQIEHAHDTLQGLADSGKASPAELAELARLKAQLPNAQGTVADTKGQYDALWRGAVQGLTFQQGDELAGLLGGDKEGIRGRNAEARENYPGTYGASLGLGGLATSAGVGGAARGVVGGAETLLGNMSRGAIAGGLEGAAWGSGGAEGVGNKVAEGLGYGGAGMIVGAGAPLAVYGGAVGVDAAKGLLGIGNKPRANRAIVEMLRKAGVSTDEASTAISSAAKQGQGEYRLMDATGLAGQRAASGVVRAGGDGAEELAAFLESRQLGQPERLSAFIDDAFDLGGRTAKQITAMLTKGRGEAADAAYGSARMGAGPVDVRGALSVIDDRIGGMAGSNIRGDGIDGKLAGFRDRLFADPAPDGEITRALSDFDRVLGVKQDVQDAIGAAVRAGRGNEARELGKLMEALDAALEDASPMYRQANDQFAASSRVIGAVDQGADMTRPANRAQDVIDTFDNMTDDQQAAARVGYGDKMLSRVEANTAPTANRAKLFQSPKVKAETDAIAVDPDIFRQRLDRELEMWETQNRALGGSRTADNLQDVADNGIIADAGRAMGNASTGGVGTALVNVGQMAGRLAKGQNEATRKLIADMLMSSDPRPALDQALKATTSSETRRRIAEALLRQLGRSAGDAMSSK